MPRHLLALALVLIGLPVARDLAAQRQARMPRAAQLGAIAFPNSGSRAAQPAFLRGVLLLHSFQYPDAADAFREAQRADPSFALAYWGEAVTYEHVLWQEGWPDSARAVLARLGPASAARAAKAGTPRERGYLAAAEALYGDGDRKARLAAWTQAMERLHDAYPSDDEATTFYALALLSTMPRDRQDYHLAALSASLSEPVFRRNPKHPGAAHYLVHAYDDPNLAPLGLPAARAYAAIAPASSHAIHMPTHIFIQRGLWDDVVRSNELAVAASATETQRRGLPVYRREVHTLDWLQYGYLQQGRVADAAAAGDTAIAFACRAEPGCGTEDTPYYADHAAAQQLLESTAWTGAPTDPSTLGPSMRYAAAVAAYHRSDTTALAVLAASLRRRADSVGGQRPKARVGASAAGGLLLVRTGATDSGLVVLRQAAELDETLPILGPALLPARELLAGVLLDVGRAADAVAAYESALLRTPGRTSTLRGRAAAAEATGDSAGAARFRLLAERNIRPATARALSGR